MKISRNFSQSFKQIFLNLSGEFSTLFTRHLLNSHLKTCSCGSSFNHMILCFIVLSLYFKQASMHFKRASCTYAKHLFFCDAFLCKVLYSCSLMNYFNCLSFWFFGLSFKCQIFFYNTGILLFLLHIHWNSAWPTCICVISYHCLYVIHLFTLYPLACVRCMRVLFIEMYLTVLSNCLTAPTASLTLLVLPQSFVQTLTLYPKLILPLVSLSHSRMSSTLFSTSWSLSISDSRAPIFFSHFNLSLFKSQFKESTDLPFWFSKF